MKPLILGAGGILGQSLCFHFHALNRPFVGLTHLELNIMDHEKIVEALEQYRPDVIFNAAAMTAVDRCETEKQLAFTINADAPGFIAGLCHKHGICFVHISTDYIFDGKKKTPYTEDDPPSPISVYAESKVEGERQVLQKNPEALIVRTAWSFRRGGKSFLCRLRELIMTRESINVANDRTGNCTYAQDLATALDALVQRNTKGIVHFSNEGGLSWFDFAIALRDTAERVGVFPCCRMIKPISSNSLKLPARRPSYSVLDKSRYCQLTGNSIRHWQETLFDFLREKI